MIRPLIFLDLDGTLIDVIERYWRIHCLLCCRAGTQPFDRDRYWELKRQYRRESAIFAMVGVAGEVEQGLEEERIALLEHPDYLFFDTLIPSALQALRDLAQVADLVLVSMRHDRDRFLAQILGLGISSFFAALIARGTDRVAKIDLVRRFSVTGPVAIIGDTEEDLETGRTLGIVSIGVSSGLGSRDALLACKPVAVVSNIGEVFALLGQLCWPACSAAGKAPDDSRDRSSSAAATKKPTHFV